MTEQFRWTDELLMEDAKKYKSRSDWAKNSPNAYRKWCREGQPPEFVEHMGEAKQGKGKATGRNVTVTLDVIKESASKFNNATDWRKAHAGHYVKWCALGKPEEVVAHFKPYRKYDKEKILELAATYGDFNQFRDDNKKLHNWMYRNGHLDELKKLFK